MERNFREIGLFLKKFYFFGNKFRRMVSNVTVRGFTGE
jgi:hypothetical protein